MLDEFLAHLTLTDRIPKEQQPAVERTLTDWFLAELLGPTYGSTRWPCSPRPSRAPRSSWRAVHPLKPIEAEQRRAEATDSEGVR